MEKPLVNLVTLGCSKNLVDSEYLLRQLEYNGFKVLHNANSTEAKIIIINTCGFILDAKQESIDMILSYVHAKKAGTIEQIYVFGCLSQRYLKELKEEMPEVDDFFGVFESHLIIKRLKGSYHSQLKNERTLTTPSHYAYLKIAEGCNRRCSFCAIPQIKGKYASRELSDILEEAKFLASIGVKELILIAQDVTYYGLDIHKNDLLPQLIEEISRIESIEWIRLQYLYPHNLSNSLIEQIKDNPKVCKYFDIPVQHISDKMLQIMRRGHTKKDIINKFSEIRDNIPDAAIRTTLLVGHPGETKKDFHELLQFVNNYKFDRLGVFQYSHEEQTYSYHNYKDSISAKEKQSRHQIIMETQKDISHQKNQSFINKTLPVMVDNAESDYYIGRTQYDSPEIDGEVIIYKSNIQPGSIYSLKISGADEYDLMVES